MGIERLRRCAFACGLVAGTVFASPLCAQQIPSVLLATTPADTVSETVTTAAVAGPPQHYESLPTNDLPAAPLTAKPVARVGAERFPSRRRWILLSVAQHGAAAFDAYSTRQAIDSGGTERNPLLRPFASSPAIYVATQVGPLVLDYAARRMQLSRHRLIRRVWWVPQSTGMAVSIYAGVHNVGVATRP